MLIYHAESDSLFWDEDFDLALEPLASDVSDELWAVERAQDLGLPVPDLERHLQSLRDAAEERRPNTCAYCNGTGWFYGDPEIGLCGCGAGVSDPEDAYWGGL
jgi:hypothetical protein